MKEPKRTDLLNHLATRYNLKRYLEIGVQNPMQNFDQIICEYKISVDPDPKAHAVFQMTSDEFYGRIKEGNPDYIFDLVFIDGLHTAEQVKKDFENALKVLSPNGFIVLHDCNPLKEEHTIVPRPTPTGHWHGDVYQFAFRLCRDSNFFTVDIDCGCGVYQLNKEPNLLFSENRIAWVDFNYNKKEILKLISWDEFIAIGSHV